MLPRNMQITLYTVCHACDVEREDKFHGGTALQANADDSRGANDFSALIEIGVIWHQSNR